MGRDFGSDRDSLTPGAPNKICRAGSAHMGDMQPASCRLSEGDVAGNHGPLGGGGNTPETKPGSYLPLIHYPTLSKRGVFTVVDDDQIEAAAEVQGTAHQPGVPHRIAVIA